MGSPTTPIAGKPPRVRMFIKGVTTTITETHWYVGDGNLPGAIAEAATLAALRLKLLGNDAAIVLTVGSLDNVLGDSLIDNSLQFTFGPNTAGPSDPGQTNLLIRMESTSKARRSLYLGLIPDKVVVAGAYDPGQIVAFENARKAYLQYLAPAVGAGNPLWGFLTRDNDPVNFPAVPFLGYGTDATGSVLSLTFGAPPPFAQGDVVTISSTFDTNGRVPWIRGAYVVDTVSGVDVSMSGSFTANLAGVVESGTLQKLIKKFVPYTNATSRGVSGHKRGGRALVPLGRKHTPRQTAF